jgi:hypothetical protein
LLSLKEGDGVRVKDMNIEDRVIKKASRLRSFIVETPKSTIERNSRSLVKLHKRVDFDKEIDIPFNENYKTSKTLLSTEPTNSVHV